MPMSLYASESHRLAKELLDELTADDIERLRSEFSGQTGHNWLLWRIENRKEICTMLSSSPLKRRRQQHWRDLQLRARFLLACIQFALHGSILMRAIDSFDIHPGRGYREMAASSGDAWLDLVRVDLNLWPFDENVPNDDWMYFPLH